MKKSLFLYIILLNAICFFQGCEKGGTCKHDTLSFSREENNTTGLRLNGFYYGDISGIRPEHRNVYLLYQNGMFYDAASYSLEEIKSGSITMDFPESRKDYRDAWGVYRIDSNKIEIENWVASVNAIGDCKAGILYQKGNLLNDTSFVIIYWKYKNNGVIQQENEVEALFHFHPFSPKPDSVVSFIK